MRRFTWLAVLALLAAVPTTAVAGRSAGSSPLAEVVSVRALRLGDTGPAVAELQELLRANGFDPGPVDGIFGPRTEAAVVAAQRHYGLAVDGLAGRMTVSSLQARRPAARPAAAVQREPGAPREGGLVVYGAAAAAAPAKAAETAEAVALTFHHLPPAGELEALLAHLRAHDARATFFVTGREAERRPADLQRIRAAGHAIGALGYREVDLRGLTPAAVRIHLRRASQAIARAVGEPPEFLRPPLGRFDRQLTRLAEEEGLKLVLWSNAVAPPGADSPSHLAAQVLRALRPGAVLMIPLEAPEGTEAARLVLEGLAEAGYRAVALSAELVDAN